MDNEALPYFNKMLGDIRHLLLLNSSFTVATEIENTFAPDVSQVYITLFQTGLKPLRWGTRRSTLIASIKRIAYQLKANPRYIQFAVDDPNQCRIMFEMVIKESPCNIRNLTTLHISKNRFEPGVNGLKYIYQGVLRFFMPTDAVTHSIMSVNQLLNFLSKQTGIAKQTDKISERVHLMRREEIEYIFIESIAYISYQQQVCYLYRGYPAPVKFDRQIVYTSMLKSIDWLVENMHEDGSFLYFYDGTKNSKADLDHPHMTDPLYNNILRHNGGTVALLRGYELTKKIDYLDAAKKSIDFFLTTFRKHAYKKHYACYPFFNKKSKLGGAGIGLVAMMHFYMHTHDESYRKQLDGLVRHLLSRVDKDGEMIGYYIHPQFNDGKAIINPSDEIKKQLFSFYYPGEALLGLALYYRHIENIEPTLKVDIYKKCQKAMDFLVDIRPVKYDYMFDVLPADAWLMQAIEEWVQVDGFKKQSYIDFVFNDTQTMFDHMYHQKNAMFADYVGGFFYNYGDHVYHDASRNEGVIAAYFLAKYLGDEHRAAHIMENMLKSAKGLMYTLHTAESTYAHQYPQKSINSFRFKLTRQWVRVDSVQHAVCFFARLTLTDFEKAINNPAKTFPDIGAYQVVELLKSSGYADVYKATRSGEKSNNWYAVKKIQQSRYINLIEKEARILTRIADFEGNNRVIIKEIFKYAESYHFVFDYIPNGNLVSQLKKSGAAKETVAIKMLQDLLQVLKFSREHKILHLDIKPANIMLDHNKNYYLIDWGLAVEGESAKTLHIKGDPIYLAPELYQGERSFSSEIYALGATLYYMLEGAHVFNLRKQNSLVHKIVAHSYFDPEFSSHCSIKMRYMIMRMLEKNPSARATIEEIEAIIQDEIYPSHKQTANNVEFDFKDETACWQKLANDGVVFAEYEMGEHYRKLGDSELAKLWYEKAANAGLARAECELALLYASENRVSSFITPLLKKAANKGLDKAQYYLGLLYEKGIIEQKDNDLAIKWFIASAKNAYRPAYNKLKQYKIVIHPEISLDIEKS